jgi:hypothetical protein
MMLKTQRFFQSLQLLIVFSLLILPLLISEEGLGSIFSVKAIFQYLIFCSIFLSIHFLHRYLLFPKLYARQKTTFYFGSLLIILAVLIFAKPFDRLMVVLSPKPNHTEYIIKKPPGFSDHKPIMNNERRSGPKVDVLSIFLFLIIVTIEVIIETNKQLSLTTQRALSAEAQKTEAELSFLKAQVNPHFLFNTLNNIYTLAIIKDENTAPSIMKLSNIMRYITDEAGNEFVSLRNEIDCIEDFIVLHELRLGKKTRLIYEINGEFEKEKKIAPLILMAFVENVFKYGVSNHKSNQLIIKLAFEYNILSLYCQNSINPDKKNTERSGIGLTNTKKRLDYIYPNKHILEINDDNELFTVKLTMHL